MVAFLDLRYYKVYSVYKGFNFIDSIKPTGPVKM